MLILRQILDLIMNSLALPAFFSLLSPHGITEAEVLVKSGIDLSDLSQPINLSADQLNVICANALRLTGDKELGMKLGMHLDLVSLGIFGYALMTSETLADAVNLLLRYNQVFWPSITINLESQGSSVDLTARGPHLPTYLERFYLDTFFAAVATNLRILTGIERVPFRLKLDYGSVVDKSNYYAVFGPSVEFKADRSVMTFDEQTLLTPISSSNPFAQDIFQRECDRIIASDNHLGLVSERVKQILIGANLDFPSTAEVANKLHMSESTLQRRLAKEGCKFQQLLDQVRYRLAMEYLQGTHLPVTEVALLLGYSSAANFRRSFKRWSGVTPADVRQIP